MALASRVIVLGQKTPHTAFGRPTLRRTPRRVVTKSSPASTTTTTTPTTPTLERVAAAHRDDDDDDDEFTMSVQEYLEKHDLSKKVEEALNAAVKAKADEPLAFVVRARWISR